MKTIRDFVRQLQIFYIRKFKDEQKPKNLFTTYLDNGKHLINKDCLQEIYNSERRDSIWFNELYFDWINVFEKFDIPTPTAGWENLEFESLSTKIYQAIESIIKKIEVAIFILNDKSIDISKNSFVVDWIPMANKKNRALGEYNIYTTFRDPRYPIDFALSIEEDENKSKLQVKIHIDYTFYKNKWIMK